MGLTAARLQASFEAHGYAATVDADDTLEFAERAKRARDSDAEVIVSAGGDGTATALAAAIAGTGKILAVLPLGTANLLARDLNLPLDLDQTVAALGAMEPRRIDVGEVNGRVFMHKVVVGLIPSIAAAREQVRGRHEFGAAIGFFRYFVRRLTRGRRMAVAITSRDTTDRIERVQAIAVANNAYDEGFGQVFSRKQLDAGRLTLYTMRHLTLVDVLRLCAEMLAGVWKQDEAISIESVRAVTLQSKRPKLSVMIDGEVVVMDTPLEFKIRPLALLVLTQVPREAPAPAAAVASVSG